MRPSDSDNAPDQRETGADATFIDGFDADDEEERWLTGHITPINRRMTHIGGGRPKEGRRR